MASRDLATRAPITDHKSKRSTCSFSRESSQQRRSREPRCAIHHCGRRASVFQGPRPSSSWVAQLRRPLQLLALLQDPGEEPHWPFDPRSPCSLLLVNLFRLQGHIRMCRVTFDTFHQNVSQSPR